MMLQALLGLLVSQQQLLITRGNSGSSGSNVDANYQMVPLFNPPTAKEWR